MTGTDLRFWHQFRNLVDRERPDLSTSAPRDHNSLDVLLGRGDAIISLTRHRPDGFIRCELYLKGRGAAAEFEQLASARESIESSLGRLEWRQREGVAARRIMQARSVTHDDQRSWPDQHAWLLERAVRFKGVFGFHLGAP